MARLSRAQAFALEVLEAAYSTQQDYRRSVFISARTLRSLRDRGLIEQYEAGHQDWRWQITEAGRRAANT